MKMPSGLSGPILCGVFLVGGVVWFPAAGGVKYGDAVPGLIRPSDLERIKRTLHLERFSVIAAVRLGAEEGREAVIAEPLPDEVLAKVKSACEAGGFCPDPVGFVGARVRIVLLDGADVVPVVTIEKEARGPGKRLVDLGGLGLAGDILGWNGRAEAANGHVALSLTPITETAGGPAGAGLDPPLLIRWNPKRGRFQAYDCVLAEDDTTRCDFQEEPPD
ncbi:MAG: hypothetical protein AAB297_08260 [Acidobacteriota bacterium]